jgi:hypothetical protein
MKPMAPSLRDETFGAGLKWRLSLWLVMAFVLTTGVGCGGGNQENDAPIVEASCAFIVEYEGHRYVGNYAHVSPIDGKPLGTATQPGCQDTPDGPAPEAREVDVSAIDGVSPDVAITIRGRDDSILIRDDTDSERLPGALARLVRTPTCSSREQRVWISGRWLGILGADGHTELDLEPPYDVRIRVTETSFVDYARAELTVRVPAILGRPLSRRDIESSLWEGGTLTATVRCRDGELVASTLTAAPPG